MKDSLEDISSYSQESGSQKLARKTKDAPFMVIGLAGCTLACLYGIYNYRRRGKMTTSIYLMQLRVTAQGTVVACLTLGALYSIYQKLQSRNGAQLKENE
uniref:HIG1 domain family protein n=1 Tax=Centruroides hentzi TaxID=88313 RepID=A0A2I9LP35_9SCOR